MTCVREFKYSSRYFYDPYRYGFLQLAKQTRRGNNDLITASSYGHDRLVKFLLRDRVYSQLDLSQALRPALREGYLSTVKLLWSSHYQIEDISILVAAFESGSIPLVSFLLERGVGRCWLQIGPIMPRDKYLLKYISKPENLTSVVVYLIL